jgi:signal peptide peptidase SppA
MSHNPQCFASHMGLWLMKWDIFSAGCNMIASGLTPSVRGGELTAMREDNDSGKDKLLYQVSEGIAIIPINGAMTKGSTKYGTSTVMARRAVRTAMADSNVEAIMLHIDSPGGTVAGTGDFADDIRAADRVKPVYAHADDLIASAAYWVGSQTRRLTLNATGEAGSIGVMGLVYDTSEQAKMEGVRPVLIKAGEHKGDFVPGMPVTDEMVARHQARVDEINAAFVATVAKGRRVPLATAQQWNTGETFSAAKAKAMGMIDEVARFDDALDYARREVAAERRQRIDAKRRDVRLRTA